MNTQTTFKIQGTCECCYVGCKGHDASNGACTQKATRRVFHPVTSDAGAYHNFCPKCAHDAECAMKSLDETL
jgi:hypothetical protein